VGNGHGFPHPNGKHRAATRTMSFCRVVDSSARNTISEERGSAGEALLDKVYDTIPGVDRIPALLRFQLIRSRRLAWYSRFGSMSSEGAPETLTGTAESQAPPTESDLPTPPRSRTTSIAEDPPAAASDDNTEENPPEMTTSSLSKSTSELSMASGGGGVATAASSPAGPTVIAWGETLKSPTLAAFSPAQVPSRHGLALQLATERAKLLNKTNKRCLALLTEVATLYDHYATALIRASQGLATHPALVHPLQECVVSWSGETSKMSATLRSDVAQPMLVYLGTTHADAVTGVAQRYQQARQEATAVRQRALAAATKYRQVTGGEEGSSNSRATSRDKYERLVKWENECVQQCQRLEGMALETLQKMEVSKFFSWPFKFVKRVSISPICRRIVCLSLYAAS
jgi:hypothetical protein